MASKKNSAMNDRQLWNVWADCLGLIVENSDEDDEDAEKKESNTMKLGKDGDEDDEDAEKKKKESNTMKLRKDDMSLFGFCPAWDDFYLVVCEHCGSVVKPQSLQSHIELRHGNTPLAKSERTESVTQLSKSPVSKGSSVSHSTSNKTTSPSARSSSLRHNSKTSSHDHSSRASTDATVQLFLQWEPCDSQTSQVASSHSSSNSSKPEKKKPQPKMKKNNAMAPVVRVERITPNLVKSTNSPSNTVSADKKELPSPQQPPPVALVTSSSTILSPSGQNSLVSGPSSTPLNTNSSSSAATGVSSTMHSMEKSEGPHLAQKKPSSENKKAPKERKLVPCKDREYDPNKHCGVVIPDTGKPCTRSLTCKTHSLSLRRAVVDRVRVFDDLLSEHRATKEATVKAAKSKSAVGKGSPIAAQNADQIAAETQPTIPEHTSSTTTTTVTSTKVELGPSKVNANTSTNGQFKIPSITPVTPQESKKTSVLQGISPNRIPSVSHGSDVCTAEPMVIEVEKRLVEPEAVFTRGSTPDPPYINHHPRPSSICTFGIRRLGNGMLLMDRRFDKVRAAFKTALSTERSSHPLPVKRLCVESRLPPVPEPLDPSDPYSFTCSESQSEPVPQITQSGPSTVINKVVMVAPTDVIQQTTPCVTTSSKTKTISVPTTSVTLSHNCSQPKTSASKTKDKSSSSSKPSNNDNRVYNSPPSKKKRKSSTIPNGSSVSKQSVLPTLSSTTSNVTLSPMTPHLSSIPSHLSMGNQLGALSRLQVMGRNNHPLSAIISNPGLTAFGGAPQHVMSKDSSVMVTGLDPLNGQMPVSSALLHSVTVSGPLLASSAGGLGITIGAGGLVSQFPQLPNRPIGENINSSTSSNKNSHTISSILNNSHVLTSDHNTWSRTKAKSKTRKNSKASVNSMSHSQNACDSSLGSGYTTILSHSLSSPSMTSPHLCSGSTSPQVPISSPLHNGLGTSPPPFFNPKTISISGTMSSNQPLSVSPASRASTPSPETDMSSPGSTGSGQKGKNFNRPIPVCLPQESEISTSPSAFQVTLPLTVTSVDMGTSVQTTLCKMEDGQTISLQQLLSSHAILDAQLCQQMPLSGRVQHENNSPTKSSTNSNLTTAILPLKLPLLMTSGTTVAHQLLQLPMDISKKNGVSKPGPPFPHH